MYALGRLFNVVTIADDVYIPLRDCGGVTFVCHLATTETYTLTEAKDAAGTGAQALATMTLWYSQATVGAAWVKNTQAAASTVVSGTPDVVVIEVDCAELSDTYDFVKLASAGAGLITAIPRDLTVQRAPERLPALV